MKRIIAALIAVSLILSMTACNGGDTSGNIDSGNASTSADGTSSGNTDNEQKLRSNPIAVDENGKIDMDVALKYETDVDALIKSLKQRHPTVQSLFLRTPMKKRSSFSII